MRARIAVCDDEMLIRLWLEEHLSDAGYSVSTFDKASDLLASLEDNPVDLALLDLRLPDGSGLDYLPRIKEIDAEIPVIMMTAYGDVETAVGAVRAGAHHFLEKPIELPELLLLIEKALETTRLMSEVDRYRDGTRWQFSDVTLIGRSFAMRRVAETITRLALRGSPATVLVQGETGTGKDLVARAIHARGPRQDKPFIAVNCTALPESLVESELFGHQAGAFTDAREEKRGLFEMAHGGTLLLDEVGDMPKAAQAKLLSVLETHVLRRVGGLRDIPIDVHVIAVTNRDLEASVGAGEFREDLFYRLSVVSIHVPPLRERREDIAPLALHFLASLCVEMGLPTRRLTPDALRSMEAYHWPGNARQLRNLLERILLLDDRDTVELASLPPEFRVMSGVPGDSGHSFVLPPDGLQLEAVERDLIRQALERTGGNKTRSARLLGLSRDTLRYRVEKHGL
ncbi:MAG: sigma-54-dependent transcriptional regulator [Longimicrobiales bacterium]